MGWIKQVCDHVCNKPGPARGDGIAAGSQWQCDECKKVYQVVGRTDDFRGEEWFMWSELGSNRE